MDFQELKTQLFINQINKLRETGVKLVDISYSLGIDISYLSNIIKGRRGLSDGIITKLLNAYSIEPAQFFNFQLQTDAPPFTRGGNKEGLPLLSLEYARKALEGAELPEMNDEAAYKIPSMLNAGFLMQVNSDEMEDEYRRGDLVAIHVLPKNTFFQPNKVYAFATEQGVFIKRIKEQTQTGLILSSANPQYPDFELKLTDITGVGIVQGLIRI